MFNLFKKKEEQPKNLKELVLKFQDLEKYLRELSEEVKGLKKNGKLHVQKIGIVRFNPFSDVGGDQSFAVALLDGNNNGFIITGLYTREGNRIYAKPVTDGKSQYFLSEEEKQAIKKAIG
jgi:hypothetical protein